MIGDRKYHGIEKTALRDTTGASRVEAGDV